MKSILLAAAVALVSFAASASKQSRGLPSNAAIGFSASAESAEQATQKLLNICTELKDLGEFRGITYLTYRYDKQNQVMAYGNCTYYRSLN